MTPANHGGYRHGTPGLLVAMTTLGRRRPGRKSAFVDLRSVRLYDGCIEKGVFSHGGSSGRPRLSGWTIAGSLPRREKMGEGGMGQVYHRRTPRARCCNQSIPSRHSGRESARKRFRKEAQTLSQLNHPNIATIYDFDTFEGIDFLAMEYITGDTVSDKLASGPLSKETTARAWDAISGGPCRGACGQASFIATSNQETCA